MNINFHRIFSFEIFQKFPQNFGIHVNFKKIFKSLYPKIIPKISIQKFSWHLLLKFGNTYFLKLFPKSLFLKILQNLIKISPKFPDHYLLKLFSKFRENFLQNFVIIDISILQAFFRVSLKSPHNY